DRLIGKEDGAFRHGVDVAGEAKIFEPGDEVFAETSRAAQPVDILLRKAQVFQEIQCLFQPSSDKKLATARQFAHKKLEDRRFRFPMLQVSLDHVELVKVSQKRASGQ